MIHQNNTSAQKFVLNWASDGDKRGSKDHEEEKDGENDADKEKREREERAAASIRKREEEVQKELSGHLHARDKERQQHRHHEAISNFQVRKSYLINIFKWTNYFFWAILKIE